MAKKITAADIAEADLFGPTRKSGLSLLKVVKDLKGEFAGLLKASKEQLQANPLKNFGDAQKFQAQAQKSKVIIEQLTQLEKQELEIQKKLNDSKKDGAKVVAAYRVELQATNKAIKDEAVLNSKSSSEIQKRRALIQQLSKLDPGSEQFIKTAREAGKLTDNINDARDAAKAFASDSKTATAKTLFTQIGSDLANLDFTGAAEKSRQFAAVISSISFKEVVAGITSFGTALANVGKALLLNPFTLLIASLAAVAFIVYDVVKAFTAMEEAAKGVDEAIKKTSDRIEGLQKRYRDAVIDIKESTGFISKDAADAQRRQVERQDKAAAAGLQIQADFNEARKKLAEDLDVDLEELEKGRASEDYSGNITQLQRNKEFNRQIVRLEADRAREVKEFNKAFKAEIQADDFKAAKEKLEKEKADAEASRKQRADDFRKLQQEIANNNKILTDLRRQFEDESLLLDSTNLERERGQASLRFLREIEALEEKIIKKKSLSAQEREINEQIIKNVELLKQRLTQELDKLETELKPIEVKLEPVAEDDVVFNKDLEIGKVEEELQKKRIEDIKKITDITLQEINKRDEASIKSLDREIAQREKNIDRQSRLAEQGLDNTLAFEKQKQAEAEVERRRLQEQQEKRQKRLAYFKAFTELLEQNPNNAAIKALAQVVTAEAIAGFFKGGVEDFKGKGTGVSDSNIVAISHGESITTAKATDKYPGLASAMNSLDVEKWISEHYAPSVKLTPMQASDPQVVMAINQLTGVVRNKRERDIDFTKQGDWVETIVEDGFKRTIRHVRSKTRI